MLLTKHEDVTFTNQTVYITGQAFIRCKFLACTLVLRQGFYHLDGCAFERCNWHVDRLLLWGDPDSLKDVRSLLDMIEKAQSQLPPPETNPQATPAKPQTPAN